MAYTPRIKTDYYVDTDTRAKTHPCGQCARDVENGRRCICVPSIPRNSNVVVTASGYKFIED